MLYFAYGSNMATARLQRRIPSARKLGVASLRGYDLRFHVASTMDGSAKCDAFLTENPAHRVIGVLFRIEPDAKTMLDGYEGVGVEYRDVVLPVTREDGSCQEALLYLGTNLDHSLLPFGWYREHVLRGALESDLPKAYVEAIRQVTTMTDPDSARAARELSIYR